MTDPVIRRPVRSFDRGGGGAGLPLSRPWSTHPVMSLRVALVQLQIDPDPDANLQRALGEIASAARQGAQLICLPELFRSPYFCKEENPAHFDLAEPIPGESTEALGKAAAEHAVSIVAPLFERRAAGVYHNSAVVIDADGRAAGTYRKMHIPDDPLYYEKFYFTPGDTGFVAVPTRHAQVGPLICWDQWFPEAARLTTLAGAQVLVYPTAIGWQFDEGDATDAAQRDAWETVQRGHAIANGVFVVAVNRVGREGPIRFWGSSFVADPFGRVLARASQDGPETLVVECDLAAIERVRQDWPFLRDRRIDAYAELDRRLRD